MPRPRRPRDHAPSAHTGPPDDDMLELARLVHAGLNADDDTLMTVADIAAFIKCRPRYVTEHYAHAPGFPQPAIKDSQGRRAWRRGDVLAWIAGCQDE